MTEMLEGVVPNATEETSGGDARTTRRRESTSTVGRGKAITRAEAPHVEHWSDNLTTVSFGDSIDHYDSWDAPGCIVSDGAYGVLGFEGDTSDHIGMAEWYEPHVEAWSRRATARTVLWFWNSEIGWATVHPVLERQGQRLGQGPRTHCREREHQEDTPLSGGLGGVRPVRV